MPYTDLADDVFRVSYSEWPLDTKLIDTIDNRSALNSDSGSRLWAAVKFVAGDRDWREVSVGELLDLDLNEAFPRPGQRLMVSETVHQAARQLGFEPADFPIGAPLASAAPLFEL